MTNPTRIQIRRGTTTQWDNSPTLLLASGEIGFVESGADKGKFKIGDGSSQWSLLNYYPLATDLSDFATESYVDAAITGILDNAPTALNTLNELAAAINDDSNYATTMTTALATKLPLAGGTMTGAIAMGTNKVTGLGTPTDNGDAATKLYVDTLQNSVEENYSLKTHTHDFDSLTDFEIVSPSAGQVLSYDSGFWKNITLSSYQLADPDLTAISNISENSGILRKTSENTWELDTQDYLAKNTGLQSVLETEVALTTSGAYANAGSITIPTDGTYSIFANATVTSTGTQTYSARISNVVVPSTLPTKAYITGGANGTNTITFTAAGATLSTLVGYAITGTGLTTNAGVKVVSVSGNTATLSKNLTANASGTYTFFPSAYASTQVSISTAGSQAINLQSIQTLTAGTVVYFELQGTSAGVIRTSAGTAPVSLTNATSLSAIRIA